MANVQVQFKPKTRAGYTRKIYKRDFGDIDQEMVVFNEANNFTAEMSQEAFDFLKGIGEPVSVAGEGADASAEAVHDDKGGDPDDGNVSGDTTAATAGSGAKSLKPNRAGSRGTTATT